MKTVLLLTLLTFFSCSQATKNRGPMSLSSEEVSKNLKTALLFRNEKERENMKSLILRMEKIDLIEEGEEILAQFMREEKLKKEVSLLAVGNKIEGLRIGEDHNVNITDFQNYPNKDQIILSHNHPNGFPLSINDVLIGVREGFGEVRAVTANNGVFIMRIDNSLLSEMTNKNQILGELFSILYAGKSYWEKKVSQMVHETKVSFHQGELLKKDLFFAQYFGNKLASEKFNFLSFQVEKGKTFEKYFDSALKKIKIHRSFPFFHFNNSSNRNTLRESPF